MLSCRVLGVLNKITQKQSIGTPKWNKHVILENKEDINRVKSLFWRIYEMGEILDLDSIHEWTLKNDKWNERTAKNFLKYIKPISEGKRPRFGRLGPGWDVNEIIRQIDENCKKRC